MTAPNLNLTVQPSESQSVVYLPLAPPKKGGVQNGQLSLRLRITNQEAATVEADTLEISFANPSAPAATIALDLSIAPGATVTRFFQPAEYILLPQPAPSEITLGVVCAGFDEPAAFTFPLTFHRSPVDAQSYRFPALAEDLLGGEYWQGISATHGAAGDGGQMFAYDMEVVARDANGNWTNVKAGGDPTKNEDYLIWGKPIHAMAEGTVVAWDDSQPTNPAPGTDLSPPGPVEGNHFYVQHGDELMLYAHLQPGTLTQSLMSQGAQVLAGDLLGLAGNSGNSSRPHLHVHTIEGTAPWAGTARPLPFHNIRVLDRTETPLTGPDADWYDVLHRGLPPVLSLIQPKSHSRWPWREFLAVDPLSLVLSRAIYVKLTLPDPPPFERLLSQIQEVVGEMSREDRLQALGEIRKLDTYVKALERVLEESSRAK